MAHHIPVHFIFTLIRPTWACSVFWSQASIHMMSKQTLMRSEWGFSEGTPAHPVPSACAQELHHKNRYWHEDCFRCAKCYKPLASEPFSARDDGKIMCGKCGSREDGNRCQGCYKVVMPGVFTVNLLFLKALNTYHLHLIYTMSSMVWRNLKTRLLLLPKQPIGLYQLSSIYH